MLKQYPTILYVLQKGLWYFLTFIAAIVINFALPRLGDNNPVDIIMGKAAQGLSQEEAKQKKASLLASFGMAELSTRTYDTVGYECALNEKGEAYLKEAFVPAIKVTERKIKDSAGADSVVNDTVGIFEPKMDASGAVMKEAASDSAGKPILDSAGVPVMKNVMQPVMVKKIIHIEKGSVVYSTTPVLENGTPVLKEEPVLSSSVVQFFAYIKNIFHGDLGLSYSQYPKPVIEIIKESLPWTLAIQFPTLMLGWIVGNLLGAIAAYKRGIFDKVFFPLAMLLNGIPFFVFGMLLVAAFSISLGWLPAMGAYGFDQVPSFSWEFYKSVGLHYILPFFSIFPILLSGQATGMRSMSIYELGTDYMKYAKWMGLREGKIVSYIFRNAMLPQLTGLAQSLGAMVGGALITEMIFSYPGLGMAMLTAIQQNDYATIQGCTLMISICVLVANFSVDILIALCDPRVKAGIQVGGK